MLQAGKCGTVFVVSGDAVFGGTLYGGRAVLGAFIVYPMMVQNGFIFDNTLTF